MRNGERFQRLGVIKGSDVGAEGSQQIIVPGGGTVDESEVRLVVVAGPPVVRVGGVIGRPHSEETAPAPVYYIAVSREGELGQRLALRFR